MALQQPRTRRLQPGEEERLLTAAGIHLRHLITVALDTGCRRGELLSLQWRHVALNEVGEPRAFVLSAHMTNGPGTVGAHQSAPARDSQDATARS